MHSETKYAKSGDVNIAYQVVGEGPLDLVFVMGWVSHLDWFWKEPHFARFLERLASFSRLILFDKRGTGLSDRAVGLPLLEERMDDVRAVMDAVGSERAALLGISEGGALCTLFGATYPERTRALVVIGGYARRIWAPDYPWGIPEQEWLRFIQHVENNWGGDARLATRAPSLVHDADFREWWRTYLQMSASPGAAAASTRMNAEIDVREVLPAIRVPTLVIHRAGDQSVTVGNGRYLAERIPDARYVELPGDDHLPFAGDQEPVLREIEVFLTGALPVPEFDRVLATLMITGIVGADTAAGRLGDAVWAERVAAHDALVRDQVARFRGRQATKTVGGFVAAFDSPARAIRCASAIVEAARGLGMTLRAGLHAGECEMAGAEIRGVALQLAERVFQRAGAGEVLVSSTVKDLVAGSGIRFAEEDVRLLTRVGEAWRLYQVSAEPGTTAANAGPDRSAGEDGNDRISPRERQVAALVAQGRSNRDIGTELAITVGTAERHVANIMNKLGCHSRAQIAAWAAEHGLLRDHAE